MVIIQVAIILSLYFSACFHIFRDHHFAYIQKTCLLNETALWE